MPGDKGGKSKHDRCVEHVKENSPGVTNPHAVCVAEGVRPAKWKKSKEEKDNLVKALADAGQRESALLLKNWDEMDAFAKAMDEELEKKYIGFNKLKSKLAAKGASNPGGLAAAIGRNKYGKGSFQHAAAEGKKMKKQEGKAVMSLDPRENMEKQMLPPSGQAAPPPSPAQGSANMAKEECHADDPKHEAKERKLAEKQKKLAEKQLEINKE